MKVHLLVLLYNAMCFLQSAFRPAPLSTENECEIIRQSIDYSKRLSKEDASTGNSKF